MPWGHLPMKKNYARGKSRVSFAAHFRVSYTEYLVDKLFVGSNSSSIWRLMFVLWSLTYLKAPMEQSMRFLLPRLLSFWLQVCVLNIHSVLPTICSRELFTLVRHFLRLTSFGFFFLNLMTCLAGHWFKAQKNKLFGNSRKSLAMGDYLRRAAYLI